MAKKKKSTKVSPAKTKKVPNKARCKKCKDIIESKYTHDFVVCKCGSIFVDGGNDYYRRGLLVPGNIDDYFDYGFEK